MASNSDFFHFSSYIALEFGSVQNDAFFLLGSIYFSVNVILFHAIYWFCELSLVSTTDASAVADAVGPSLSSPKSFHRPSSLRLRSESLCDVSV